MSGFLDRMAARAQGTPETGRSPVHLRPRARFEPVPDWPPAGAASVPRQSRLPDQQAAAAPVAAPTGRRRPRSVPVPTGSEPDSARQPGPTTPVGAGPQVQRKAGCSEPDGDPPVPLATPHTEHAVLAAESPPPDRPRPSAVVAPDPLVLVRHRVVPVLVDAGVLGRTEDIEVVDAAAPEPAVPQAWRNVRLRVDTPRPAHRRPTGPEPRDGRVPDLHVHIGRIEVVRPTAPPPAPAPARRVTPAVDHAAYLARRRERR